MTCWGTPGYPPAGVGVTLSTAWAKVSVGYDIACGILSSGQMKCWGANSVWLEASVPPELTSNKWKAVATGWKHVCGILQDNTIRCWGPGEPRENLSLGTTETPGTIKTWVALSSSPYHTCAIRDSSSGAESGRMECWVSGLDCAPCLLCYGIL